MNGSIFPIAFDGQGAPTSDHVRWVAGVFSGDEVSEIGDRQLSLDFQCYDFSYIPIETLSNVYEQFLHAPSDAEKPGRGREIGAYYTPIPVVNLMLSELEERQPLTRGTRVFDPACGSGAFLVQCYRRLIEKELPPKSKPTPGQLGDLLERTIFGVDLEEDACNVAELSLILTLLDYVDPPDLEGVGQSRFQLPALRGNNIFCANFFENPEETHEPLTRKFRWIVGNPPWKRLNPKKLPKAEKEVWRWMADNVKDRPVGGNQIARAFAWKVLDYLAEDGEVALFLPAMTLFEDPARDFRRAFFRQVRVNTVANLSNLAEVLSAGRFRVPAAAFFYEKRDNDAQGSDEEESVRVYSPLVANQEPTRPTTAGRRNESWSIVVNASEIRDIPTIRVADGSGLPWKLATWGSNLDERLLNKLKHRFDSVKELERKGRIIVSEGLQLRREPQNQDEAEEVELVEEVVGKNRLDVAPMKRLRHVFSFPSAAIVPAEPELKYVRKGRAKLPLSVCRGQHVIVSAARTFAVYEERYLVVPPHQIGIVSPTDDKQFLKALSLYLSSDFALYHQFLESSQFGVKRDVATLGALRLMPIAISNLSAHQLKRWESLHSRLVRTTPQSVHESQETAIKGAQQLRLLPDDEKNNGILGLLRELNDLVNDSLELDAGEKAIIRDLVHVRLALNDGKTGRPAVRSPKTAELRAYGQRLKSELDDFIDGELPKRHQVAVVHDNLSGMVQVDLMKDGPAARDVKVFKADDSTARQLEETRGRLRAERSQWVYFDRNLRVYEGTRTYLFKPMQRVHWTESQAMIDARSIIAETLEGAKAEP
ncbi:MAG: N-6 DNA methylase [Thermoguttaceae bacterium]